MRHTEDFTDDQTLLSLEQVDRRVDLEEADFGFLQPLKPTVVFSTYWRFANERQRIFMRRAKGEPDPWTDDPTLRVHKFTNAYRASDRVSQYLIRNVIYSGDQSPNEVFFRIILFKFFNRIETWQLLKKEFGEIRVKDFRFETYDKVLSAALSKGQRLYSAAYIMPSGGRNSGFARKHQMHLQLVKRMINEAVPERLASARRMSDAFTILRSYPTIGDFLAYQYVIDINYSELTDFSEMEFVVPGPGARDGIRKCFHDMGGLTEAELISFITRRQVECFEAVRMTFPTLWGRQLQLIDCQNLFCEVDKYARVVHSDIKGLSGRTRIKQKFHANKEPIPYFYPPKWKLNVIL